MRQDTRLGTLDELYAGADPTAVEIAEAVRAEVAARDPDGVEWPSPREKTVNWGTTERKMTDGYAYVMLLKGRANLGFFRGTALPDPAGLLEGTGKALRHIKVGSADEVRRPEVLALIEAAIAERRGAA